MNFAPRLSVVGHGRDDQEIVDDGRPDRYEHWWLEQRRAWHARRRPPKKEEQKPAADARLQHRDRGHEHEPLVDLGFLGVDDGGGEEAAEEDNGRERDDRESAA